MPIRVEVKKLMFLVLIALKIVFTGLGILERFVFPPNYFEIYKHGT